MDRQRRIYDSSFKGKDLMPKIYESPDGGKTVYSREFGSDKKNFEWEDAEEVSKRQRIRERKEWDEILNAAEFNPSLQEAVERVKILYHLSKRHG
jgi:hypothetical protein